ncbi:MAG: HupE/UreJ family protein [Sphingomonas sp.]|nr:HupE/UreJ family protein [Sphingomonas sp.]
MPWLRLIMMATALLCAASRAEAHLTPNSEVNLDFGQQHAIADIIIPQGEYAFATGNPVRNAPDSLAKAKAYLIGHMAVTTPQGRPWRLVIDQIEFVQIAGPPDLHAIVRLIPPQGAAVRRLAIDWRAIINTVPNHFVLFVVRSDFAGGRLDKGRQVLGALQGARHRLVIDRGTASSFKGFQAAFALGMRHIAEGHDHLLFLFALLLPAPLLAAGGVWRGARPIRVALWQITKIVSAFTAGHSLTLIGAALFDWHLPSQPVEIAIALSILISAIHAWRPLFPGQEPIVAAGFGLVHGLAFATVIARFGLDIQEKALSILGFNLGIEAVQLLVVLATMPSLLMLSRTRFYQACRSIGASAAGLAALAWLAERLVGYANPVAQGIDLLLGYAPYLVAMLTIGAALAFLSPRGRVVDLAR